MTMKRLSIIINLCLGILLAGVFSPEAFAQPKFDFTPPKGLDENEIAKKSLAPDKVNKDELVTRKVVTYSSWGLKDPFKPLAVEAKKGETAQIPVIEESLPALTVQGLLWGGVFPQAIINNKVVKEGDKIEGATIKEINKEGVTVHFANSEYKLSSPAVTGPQQSTDSYTRSQ